MSRRFSKAEDLEDDASSRRIIVVDLNIPHPDTQEVEEENRNNEDESPNNVQAGGAYSSPPIDWSSGSVDIADDGRLHFVQQEPSPPPEGLDLASAVAEAEAMEDAQRRSMPDSNDPDVDVDDDGVDDVGVEGYDLWTY